MFVFLKKPRPRSRFVPAPLGVERLEARDCPSGLTPIDRGGDRIEIPESPVQAVLNLDPIHYGTRNNVTISGTVTEDGEPADGALVVLDGAATGMVYTEPDGTFTISLQANSVGQVTAQGFLASAEVSNTDSRDIINEAPVFIEFVGIGGNHPTIERWWRFEGQIQDDDPTGLTVTFTGMINTLNAETAEVAEDGSFYLWVYLDPYPEDHGNAWVNVSDWFGQTATPISFPVERPH